MNVSFAGARSPSGEERGFEPEQVLTILSATVATPSHLDFDGEEGGARRWVPWIFGTKLPNRDVCSTVAIGDKPDMTRTARFGQE
jgi:hypothetical protein